MFGLDGNIQWKPALFICSFIVLNVWVVLQISVAVLLDNFVTVAMKVESDEKKRMVHDSQFNNPLEPLIAKLAYEYTDSADLSSKLIALFQVGTADCLQFQLLPQRAIDSSDSTVQQ